MSAKHLATGSAKPPKVEGKLRLYSMEYCPFAERVRLVLLVKNIPHDIVNVHLKEKPEWLFDLHPEGKVPALDTGSELVIESLDISDYLDEQYPEPPLYPKDAQKRQQDKDFIKESGSFIVQFFKSYYNREQKTFVEQLELLEPHVQRLENELGKRGVYFGGSKANMIDYMLWPWGERAHLFEFIFKEKLPDSSKYPNLYAWCKAMRTLKPVQETETSPDRLYKLYLQYVSGGAVNYDNI